MPLVVCATPIGNLEDVTLRLLAELRAADLVLCEDTRHTRGLLERHGIDARLLSYHEHNEAARTSELVPRLVAGERIALVSDAGMPGVSDPGARIVRAALDAGVEVTVLPGAVGRRDGARRVAGSLPSATSSSASCRAAPVRLPRCGRSSLELGVAGGGVRVASSAAGDAALARGCRSPARSVAVCRELTKRFEEVTRGTAAELADRSAEPPKGEITLVIGPAPARAIDESAALAAVAELVEAGLPRKRAAELVARLTGAARNRLYRGSL